MNATSAGTGRGAKEASKPATKQAAGINAWQDDPAGGTIVTRPVPDIAKQPLAYRFPKSPPKAGLYSQGTPEFRYWTAAEALRRGADFWAATASLTKWQIGKTLPVLLDEGDDLNAYYDRRALNFFHGPLGSKTVYSGESPDVLCHEMGHAILDSLRPDLWDAASHEAAAFHESFGDMSAILSGLQLQPFRVAVLAEVNGKLYKSSRLSRLAEQLGDAIRAQAPDAVDRDCLRNAVNSFTYQDPTKLPSSAPANQLSSEAHSFSRVFTGAFFEALGNMLHAKAKSPNAPTEAELAKAASDMGTILVRGIMASPISTDWYSQVAAHMIIAAAPVDAAYAPILKATFAKRQILSLHSLASIPATSGARGPSALSLLAAPAPGLSTIAIPAQHYGIDGPLLVEAASQPRRFALAAAAAGATSSEAPSSALAAQAFVDDLFRRGRVEYGNLKNESTYLDHGPRLKSHRLVRAERAARLTRNLFDCGCHACAAS